MEPGVGVDDPVGSFQRRVFFDSINLCSSVRCDIFLSSRYAGHE